MVGRTPRMGGYSRGVLSESNKKVIRDGVEIRLTGGGFWCIGVVGYRSFVGNGARPEETVSSEMEASASVLKEKRETWTSSWRYAIWTPAFEGETKIQLTR
ncbi:hypothetical protein L2E82_02995 [Cichorium intybus]|uniref:Uncharacterized protein n=1 Tax=Cichorium intybus TaxID=13427 RepID=A0ACB9H2V1_CICIN|nr:hypothetical protein L2E82_02995 [Cichorium intybus]